MDNNECPIIGRKTRHGRCDQNQRVKIGDAIYQATIHAIHPVKGYSTLFGFVFAQENSSRSTSLRLVAGSDTWEEYIGLGLDKEHWIGKHPDNCWCADCVPVPPEILDEEEQQRQKDTAEQFEAF